MDLTPMLIGGKWRPAVGSGRTEDVTSPYDGSAVATVPVAGSEDVEAALAAAEVGAERWRQTPAHSRMKILLRAAEFAVNWIFIATAGSRVVPSWLFTRRSSDGTPLRGDLLSR